MMVCARAREGFYQTCTDGPPLPTHAVSGGALVLLHRGLRDALSPTMSHSRSWSEIRTCGTCGHFFQKPTSKGGGGAVLLHRNRLPILRQGLTAIFRISTKIHRKARDAHKTPRPFPPR